MVFKKNIFFFHQCLQQRNRTICYNELFFWCESKEFWVRKLRLHQPPGSEITHPNAEQNWKNHGDLVWKKENGWWLGNQVSTHFAFMLLDKDAWVKRRLENIKEMTGRAKRCWQSVYLTEGKKKVHLECQPSVRGDSRVPSCHDKLIDKNCHRLSFIFRALLRGCIPCASHVNWGLLPDLGDQFSVNRAGWWITVWLPLHWKSHQLSSQTHFWITRQISKEEVTDDSI